jgi:hypothetical protein
MGRGFKLLSASRTSDPKRGIVFIFDLSERLGTKDSKTLADAIERKGWAAIDSLAGLGLVILGEQVCIEDGVFRFCVTVRLV